MLISEYIRYHGLINFMIESIFDQAIGELPAFLLAVKTSEAGPGARLREWPSGTGVSGKSRRAA